MDFTTVINSPSSALFVLILLSFVLQGKNKEKWVKIGVNFGAKWAEVPTAAEELAGFGNVAVTGSGTRTFWFLV